MRVVAFASQNDGTGKTTLAAHLAVAAERAGAGSTVLLEVDPDGRLVDWWKARPNPQPAFARTTPERLAEDIAALRAKGFGLVFLDTPAARGAALRDILRHAELVVVPTRATAAELGPLAATVDLCDQIGRAVVVALMGATRGAPIDHKTAIALSQHGVLAPAAVHHHEDFAAAMTDGASVAERDPAGAAAGEIAALWRYLAGRLERNFRRTVFTPPASSTAGFGRRTVAR